jgi:hypothetical protein
LPIHTGLVKPFARLCADGIASSVDDHPIARFVSASARQFHAVLRDEALQQRIERTHDFRLAVNFEQTMLFDRTDAVFLYVTGDDARESAAQIGGKAIRRLITIEFEARHVFMRRLERHLQFVLDAQCPVEEERVLRVEPIVAHLVDAFDHELRDFCGVVDDDVVALRDILAQRQTQEFVP